MISAPHHNPIIAAWETIHAGFARHRAVVAEDGKTVRTFEEIETEARALEASLAEVVPGSVAAIQIGNDPRFPALLLALWRRRLVPLPLDLSVDGLALEQALKTCQASLLITRSARGVLDFFPTGIEPVFAKKGGADFLKLTSGTTGAPRAIRFRAAQLLADCISICGTMGIGAGDLNYGVIPWAHSYGFSNLVTPLLCRGIPVVATEERLPRAILNGITRTGATVFPGLPIFYQKLAELDIATPPKLRVCISAGAPLPGATTRRFHERHGLKVHSFYGSSECGGIAYDTSDDPAVEEGCVGQPMRGVAVVRHPQDPERIEVRGESVGEGYFPSPDEDVLAKGRFIPSDLIRITPTGLVITGRVSDFINVAGRKVSPFAIEACLKACPGVSDAVVFGIHSDLRGEEPVACVVAEGLTPADLLRYCRAEMPAWQVPKDLQLVEEIPANERGKVNRRALAEEYQEYMRQLAAEQG